jgi:uncharacterized RDD family membrane protein YckC
VVDQMASYGVALLFVGSARMTDKLMMPLWDCVTYALYCLLFEAFFQRTPGKWITGCHVVSETGERASFGQLVTRTLCRFVPFDGLSFAFGGNWHDRWSGTRVIDD